LAQNICEEIDSAEYHVGGGLGDLCVGDKVEGIFFAVRDRDDVIRYFTEKN